MSDLAELLAGEAGRILDDLASLAAVQAIEPGGWAAPLWAAVEEAGLHRACLPESEGGAGLELAAALPLVRRFARHAAPIPFADALLAAVLLSRAGLDIPEGALTMADTPLASAPFPQAVRVPYARHARFALLWQAQGSGTALFLIGPGAHPLAPGENPAGEPRDRITLGEVPQTIAGHLEWPAEQVRAWGALLRSAQMVGAMQHVLDVAVEHANTRVQFGRTIGSFQALQHRLVVAYGQCATAAAAVDAAAGLSGCGPHPLAVPAAKIRAGAAAAIVARTAHQVLGAMGYTREHSLHLFTRRLWSWRDDFGSEAYWARRLGAEARRRSSLPDGLWAWITADETA